MKTSTILAYIFIAFGFLLAEDKTDMWNGIILLAILFVVVELREIRDKLK